MSLLQVGIVVVVLMVFLLLGSVKFRKPPDDQPWEKYPYVKRD